MTQNFNTDVKRMAHVLQWEDLIGELAGGDVIAKDAVYHLQCYTALRNSYRSYMRHNESYDVSENIKAESIAFAELISFIEEFGDESTVLKLPDCMDKSDLLAQLEPLVELHRQVPERDVTVVDGAALVQSHNPKNYKLSNHFKTTVT